MSTTLSVLEFTRMTRKQVLALISEKEGNEQMSDIFAAFIASARKKQNEATTVQVGDWPDIIILFALYVGEECRFCASLYGEGDYYVMLRNAQEFLKRGK